MRLRRRSVRTPRRAGVGVVVGLGLGARLGGVGRQPGGSEDVLAGPALGGCIHTIVCGTRDQVRKGRELGGNWMFQRANIGCDYIFQSMLRCGTNANSFDRRVQAVLPLISLMVIQRLAILRGRLMMLHSISAQLH